MTDTLSHITETGEARMVDVGGKSETNRTAIAQSLVKMQPNTLDTILKGDMPKGDVLGTARIAGIMAAKKTSDLIPLCHPLPITSVKINITPEGNDTMLVEAIVKVAGKTGVEMEALTAASVAALTIYDMAKAVDKGIVISATKLLYKEGGKSGTYEAKDV